MSYILISIDEIGSAYQQVDSNGFVIRYVDLNGNVLFDQVPTGLESAVLDPNPPRLDWMV